MLSIKEEEQIETQRIQFEEKTQEDKELYMEAANKERSSHGGGVNEEKRNESSAHEEGCKEENIVIKVKPSSSSSFHVSWNI